MAAFASAATDNSSAPHNSSANLGITSWDFVNLAGGAGFRVGAMELTLGLQYGLAESESQRLVDASPEGALPEDVEAPPATVVARRTKLILGFSVGY